MCGIAGYVCTGEYNSKIDRIFPMMALFMEKRGNQSFGWTDGERIEKRVGEVTEFWEDTFLGAKQAALHTRWSTTGAITSANQHPWRFGNIIGMHNGIVYNHTDLNKDLNRSFEVDSMHIFQNLLEGRGVEEIEAYGAIVYFKDGIIHLCRFNGGDMAIAHNEFGVFFASTDTAIETAFCMAGLPQPTFYKVEADKVYWIRDGALWENGEQLFFAVKTYNTQKWDSKKVLDTYSSHYGHQRFDERWLPSQYQFDHTDYSKELDTQNKRDTHEYSIELDIAQGLRCAQCEEPFDVKDSQYDTADGVLCDDCAAYFYNDEDSSSKKSSMVATSDDYFDKTTVVDYLKDNELDSGPHMTDCDECHRTLNAYDDLYVDSTSVPWKLCMNCHSELVAPLPN